LLPGDPGAQARINVGAQEGVEQIPHLSFRLPAQPLCTVGGRMHLDRQPLLVI
jgi:hypothetical protein